MPHVRYHRSDEILQQRKQLILNFIHIYREMHKVSPSIDEITIAIGYGPKSYGSVTPLINELIHEGWLKRAVPGGRTLVLTHPPDEKYFPLSHPEIRKVASRQKDLAAHPEKFPKFRE